MKTEKEIHAAHDLLCALLGGHVPVDTDADSRQIMIVSLQALCWALDHRTDGVPDAPAAHFEQVLQGLRAAAHRAGYAPKSLLKPSDN